MKKNNGYLSLAAGIMLFAVFFMFSEAFAAGISAGLSCCANILIPSLFPFLIAASLTGSGTLPEPVKKIAEPVTRFLLGLPADCLTAIAVGQLGGYLSGAKAVQSLYSAGVISRASAERMLLFCINAGMGFAVNAVGNGMLCSREAGRVLLASLCISSLLTGILSRLFIKDDSASDKSLMPERPAFSAAIVGSVSSAAQATVTACAFVILFSGINSLAEKYIKNETASAILSCILEVTGGCADIARKAPLPVIAAVCAFGGICVHLQVFAVTREIGINIPRFYLFRLIHSTSAYAVCRLILHFRPVSVPVSLSLYGKAELFSFSAPAAISLLFMCFLLILDLDNNRKIC